MGFFGAYLLADGRWTDADPDQPSAATSAEPWMCLTIHDSDIATVRYAPCGQASGEAFLGMTPRTYFEDPSASAPTDTAKEAVGLAAWAAVASDHTVAADAIQRFLVGDDDQPFDDADSADDADIFVEVKSAQFLRALGLPLPADLRQGDDI